MILNKNSQFSLWTLVSTDLSIGYYFVQLTFGLNLSMSYFYSLTRWLIAKWNVGTTKVRVPTTLPSQFFVVTSFGINFKQKIFYSRKFQFPLLKTSAKNSYFKFFDHYRVLWLGTKFFPEKSGSTRKVWGFLTILQVENFDLTKTLAGFFTKGFFERFLLVEV